MCPLSCSALICRCAEISPARKLTTLFGHCLTMLTKQYMTKLPALSPWCLTPPRKTRWPSSTSS
nr:MAG TPA: hypothetical protein [Caudoviricetes sp.]